MNCRNMNHGKPNPPVCFCPNCGEKFKTFVVAAQNCSDEKHRERRKSRCTFCFDCGKKLG